MQEIKNVLLIEDNPGDARLVREFLSFTIHRKANIIDSASLADAIEILESTEIDLVLTDLSLPDSNGIDTFISVHTANSEVPIILLSGNTDQDLAVSAVRKGAQDYLVKDQIEPSILERAITYALERKKFENEIERAKIEMERASKMASIGVMAGGIAHEINNPLAIICGNAESILESLEEGDLTNDCLVECCETIVFTVRRISDIVQGLKDISRNDDSSQNQIENIFSILNGTIKMCREPITSSGISLKFDLPKESFDVKCNQIQLSQVFLNLLNNAKDAVEGFDDPFIQVKVKVKHDIVIIQFIDNGPGIPQDLHDKIMDPFFTTKEVGKGTGLGLSLSRSIVESHGGSIQLNSQSENTTFEVTLPRAQSELKKAA